jgi:hypothetical protein
VCGRARGKMRWVRERRRIRLSDSPSKMLALQLKMASRNWHTELVFNNPGAQDAEGALICNYLFLPHQHLALSDILSGRYEALLDHRHLRMLGPVEPLVVLMLVVVGRSNIPRCGKHGAVLH